MVRVHWPWAASPRSLPPPCCLGPLVLVLLGFSDARIGHLTALAPYRPIFIAVAMGFQFFAYRRIFRPTVCSAWQCVCVIAQVLTASKGTTACASGCSA